jgi:hypothetical protein
MGIFKQAADLNKLPKTVTSAIFDNNEIEFEDEFEGILREASSNRAIYENRLKSFKQASVKHEYEEASPAIYDNYEGGIRRAGFGQKFANERSELFGYDTPRSISYDNNPYSAYDNGLSIWEPEFDDIQDAFSASQRQSDSIFDRKTMAEKKALSHKNWEKEQSTRLRKSNVLPYRDHAVSRFANEEPLRNGKFNTVNDFYAEATDSFRDMIRESNSERKTKIQRKGIDPADRIDQWQNKEAIAARTMEALNNSSLLSRFADSIGEDLYD